jgi:hypothetical protein
VHGLIDLDERCVIWDILSVMEIIQSSTNIRALALLSWLFMLMI